MTEEVEYERRFGGVGRLLSKAVLERLRGAHVCVIGVGGIGSWTVEALVRSGVGELTLVDLDEVCVSNVNRQVHATQGTVGKVKVGVMAERAREIQPGVVVNEEVAFYTKGNSEAILAKGFDCVVDAIDSGKLKAHL
ncbi:MAG: ThiF family adenylyltransferase, partial [Verrucomicrobiales bacterium]|nr:ThiF family adenylyltransferase [Verrucomicrobiales bacterium]